MSLPIDVDFVDRGSIPAWLILGLGVIFGVVSLVMSPIPKVLGVIWGLLVVGSAVYDMWRPSTLSVGLEAASGVLVFLLPWIGRFAGTSASWLTWVFGILIIAGAAWSWGAHPAR